MWFIPSTHEYKIFHFLELQLKKRGCSWVNPESRFELIKKGHGRVNEPGLSGYDAVEGLRIICCAFVINVSFFSHEMYPVFFLRLLFRVPLQLLLQVMPWCFAYGWLHVLISHRWPRWCQGVNSSYCSSSPLVHSFWNEGEFGTIYGLNGTSFRITVGLNIFYQHLSNIWQPNCYHLLRK